MTIAELLRCQYQGYATFHRSRTNLLIHILVVPLFIAGNVGLIVAIAHLAWLPLVISIATMIVSVALQGRGHGREQHSPEPFTSATNAVARVFLEQWITFPRFVLSGGWWRALSQSIEQRSGEPAKQ